MERTMDSNTMAWHGGTDNGPSLGHYRTPRLVRYNEATMGYNEATICYNEATYYRCLGIPRTLGPLELL